MIPQHLLPRLSPAAAKLYLALRSLHTPPAASVSVPIARLIQLTGLSATTCKLALRQLRQLDLIRRLPRRFHTPNTYLLLFPNHPAISPSAVPLSSNSRPAVPVSPSSSRAAVSLHHIHTLASLKNAIGRSAVPLLTPPAPSSNSRPAVSLPNSPPLTPAELLRRCFSPGTPFNLALFNQYTNQLPINQLETFLTQAEDLIDQASRYASQSVGLPAHDAPIPE